MKLQEADIEALQNSSKLLQFVSEHREKTALPEDLVKKITQAWELSESNQWTPAVATDFWLAYSSLCDIAQPTTIDTISMNAPVARRRPLSFGSSKDASQPPPKPQAGGDDGAHATSAPPVEQHPRGDQGSDGTQTKPAWMPRWLWQLRPRTRIRSRQFAAGCMTTLLVFLALVVIFGYIASSADTLSREIRDLEASADKVAPLIRTDIEGIAADLAKLATDDKTKGFLAPNTEVLDQKLDGPFPTELRLKITQLRERLQDIYYDTDTMYQKVQAISKVMPFVEKFNEYQKGDLTPVPVLRDAVSNLSSYYVNRRNVNERLQSAWIWISMYNGFVPMLLGALGAATYVVRLISEEIRGTTFSRTAPIRHVMRIALGALAGVIIGFGGIVTGTGLSSAALAFIAGYAVEPVFSTLDGIAEKFRTSREAATTSK